MCIQPVSRRDIYSSEMEIFSDLAQEHNPLFEDATRPHFMCTTRYDCLKRSRYNTDSEKCVFYENYEFWRARYTIWSIRHREEEM